MKRVTKKAIPEPAMKQVWIMLGVALLVLITFVSVYFNSRVGVGQAIFIGETPWAGGTIDLVQEESFTFTALPSTQRNVTFATGTSAFDPSPEEYWFQLVRLGNLTYSFSIEQPQGLPIARDILSIAGTEDSSLIYLTLDDASPDVEVRYQNGQVTVRNLHFVPPDSARIQLLDDEGMVLPPVIRLNTSQSFSGQIIANSSSPPTIQVDMGTLSGVTPNPTLNSTFALFEYTAPGMSSAVILDITANVLGQITHKYYTFAVGNIAYALQESNFPQMTITLLEDTTAQLNVTFARTQELQAFALPCLPTASTLDALFGSTVVERVHTYDALSGQSQVWTQGPAPDEFNTLALFRGYFVRLRPLTDADSTSIITTCQVQSLQSASATPPGAGAAPSMLSLRSGWNLISLPGLVPRPLTDFTTATNLIIFQCSQNYQCTPLPVTSPLSPGKPYWVWTQNPVTIPYTLQ